MKVTHHQTGRTTVELKSRFKIWLTLMYLVGAFAVYLSISGHGGRLPMLPLVLGIICIVGALAFTVSMIRGPRNKSQR
jgi:fatty acid desaturase